MKKISKKKLQQIIAEELSIVITEQGIRVDDAGITTRKQSMIQRYITDGFPRLRNMLIRGSTKQDRAGSPHGQDRSVQTLGTACPGPNCDALNNPPPEPPHSGPTKYGNDRSFASPEPRAADGYTGGYEEDN
jgi:hypothetical protein